MQKNKTKIRFIMIILFILLILLIVLSVVLKRMSNQEDRSSTHDTETPIVGSKNLVKDAYSGSINTIDISNRVTILFEDYLPLVISDVLNYDDNELQKFYQSETKEGLIYRNLGINNYEDFKKFIVQLKELDCELSDVETVEYIEDSYESGEIEDSIITNISYNNEENNIECKVYIPKNYDKNNVILRFEILSITNN